MADITDLLDYFQRLLIIQYHNKPKAQATIRVIAEALLASGIALDVMQAYNLDGNEDVWDPPSDVWDPPIGDVWDPAQTIYGAVGKQLDMLGKYEGIDRYYRDSTLVDYFSLETYTEPAPSSPPRYGFTDYTDYDTTPPNGCLLYAKIISVNNKLLDPEFRTAIKLKILQNYLNHSNGSIDSGVFHFFGNQIRPEEMYNMHMAYFISGPLTPFLIAVLYKKLLPRPMAVGALVIEGITGLMFAMTDYTGYETPFGYGFSDYADYDTLTPQQTLIYDQILTG